MANRAPFEVKIANKVGSKDLRTALKSSATDFFAQIAEDFKEFVDDLEVVLPETMVKALEPTLVLSQTYVPYKTGALHDSGYVEVSSGSSKKAPQAEIGYGKNGEAPYALVVHEVPRYHEPPTRYKYLQAALDEDYFAILGRIATGVKTQTGL